MYAHPGSNRRALPPPVHALFTRFSVVAFAIVLGALLVYAPHVTLAVMVSAILLRSLTRDGGWAPRRPVRRRPGANRATAVRTSRRSSMHAGAIDWRLLVSVAGLGVLLLLFAQVMPDDIGIILAAVGLGGLAALRLSASVMGLDRPATRTEEAIDAT